MLNTTLKVPDTGFSVAGLDIARNSDLIDFKVFLFIVVIVVSILL